MLDEKPTHRVPPQASTLGMYLFLAALTMLFGATMLAYMIIRTTSAAAPPLRTLRIPAALWLSTGIILLASHTIHQALIAVRQERQLLLRRYLLITCLLAAGFVIIQTPSLWSLLSQHQRLANQGLRLYGLIFFLILVHALHVVGGIIALALTTAHARRHRYDHEHYAGVRNAALYWHFLDAVWLIMFLGIFFVG